MMYAVSKKVKDFKTKISLNNSLLWPFVIASVCGVALLIALIVVLTLRNDNSCKVYPNNLTTQNLYLHAAVASDAFPCANIANNIMMVQGGNAVDGAIAGLICDCAVNFHSCGIGGGSFIVLYIKKDKKVYAIDLREEAPAAANETMFVNDTKAALIGGKSIAVMGLVSGYYEIHQRFGNLSWALLFQQTIDLLNTGFYVSKTLVDGIDYFILNGNKTEFRELWTVISRDDKVTPKKFGDIIKLPKLSKTLARLAQEPYAMKNGSLVDIIVGEIQSAGGIITRQDLAKYVTKWRTPVSVTLNDGDIIYTMPPPSSGALVALILNVLDEYSFDSSYLDSCEKSGLFLHRFIETLKFAFAKRSELGDLDYVNVTQIMANLTSDNYAKWIRSLITDDRTHPFNYYHPSFADKNDHGTAHFSLISRDGDAVSATSTINYWFGSLVMGSTTGIVYNDEMDDFSIPGQDNIYNVAPSPSNFIRPGKRPMSSMSPIIIVGKNGDVNLVVGAAGGTKIISATALVSTLTTLLKMSVKESIDYPRVHHQLLPNQISVEPNFPKDLENQLKKRGHAIDTKVKLGVVMGIHRSIADASYVECNSDFRKGGQCGGY